MSMFQHRRSVTVLALLVALGLGCVDRRAPPREPAARRLDERIVLRCRLDLSFARVVVTGEGPPFSIAVCDGTKARWTGVATTDSGVEIPLETLGLDAADPAPHLQVFDGTDDIECIDDAIAEKHLLALDESARDFRVADPASEKVSEVIVRCDTGDGCNPPTCPPPPP